VSDADQALASQEEASSRGWQHVVLALLMAAMAALQPAPANSTTGRRMQTDRFAQPDYNPAARDESGCCPINNFAEREYFFLNNNYY